MVGRRALIYTRISQDRGGAGLGVDRQLQDCTALANRLDWEVVGHHRDNDVSAYSGKPRPGYRALLEDLEARGGNAVVAWHTDRLHRSPTELEYFVTLCERLDVAVQTVQAGLLDLTTPSGRLVARMLGASARYEVEHKSARTRRAQLQAAQAGRWLGGARPFGWQVHSASSASVDPDEAHELQVATRTILEGGSLGGIVSDLNARGVPTTTGKRWTYATLRQMLRRPRNAGFSVLNGEVLGRSMMPAIISEQDWRQVCAVLEDPSRRTSYTNRARWLLAGIARCGTCGTPLKSASASGRTPRTVYRCPAPGVGHVARRADSVDEHVSTIAVALLQRENLAELMGVNHTVDTSGLVAEGDEIRARMREAAELFASLAITGGQLSEISSKLRKRLEEIEHQLQHVGGTTALAPFVAEVDAHVLWQSLSLDRRRAVIRELMDVVILPGRRGREYQPELTHITPRL